MSRHLPIPRLLGLHVLTVILVVVMGGLGWWQLGRARELGRPPAPAATRPVPLDALTAPRRSLPPEAVGRLVSASGAYDAGHQLLVAGRPGPAGRTGFWLLTPLRLADGAALPIVRGWVPAAGDPAAAVPAGKVTVTGRLQPSEPPAPPDIALPPGQIRTVTTAELVSVLPHVLYDGYLVLIRESPPPRVAPQPVAARPPEPPHGGLALRNAAYAVQWWVFALFTVVMWWRLVREQRRDSLTRRVAVETEV